MGDKSGETILHRHCVLYRRVFRAQREQKIEPFYAHRKADREADEKFHLTPEERQKRDAWLDSRLEFKGWRVEPPDDKGTSLFDDLIMRVE